MKHKFTRGVVVVECKSIEFASKDIIHVKCFDDFVYLLGGGACVFKLGDIYYCITDVVAYCWGGK